MDQAQTLRSLVKDPVNKTLLLGTPRIGIAFWSPTRHHNESLVARFGEFLHETKGLSVSVLQRNSSPTVNVRSCPDALLIQTYEAIPAIKNVLVLPGGQLTNASLVVGVEEIIKVRRKFGVRQIGVIVNDVADLASARTGYVELREQLNRRTRDVNLKYLGSFPVADKRRVNFLRSLLDLKGGPKWDSFAEVFLRRFEAWTSSDLA